MPDTNLTPVRSFVGYPEDPMENVRSYIGRAYNELPLDQAQQAVEAAMRYQGIRGYQRDLQGGMSGADAMMKWGPVMMPGKQSSLGGAAALMRAGAMPKLVPATTNTPAYLATQGRGAQFFPQPREHAEWIEETRNINGVAVPGQRNRMTNEWKPLHPPVAKPETALDAAQKALLQADVSELKRIEGKLETMEPSSGFLGIIGGNKAELKKMDARAKEIRAKIAREYGSDSLKAGTTRTGTSRAPQTGEVYKGWRFKGGDPSKRENWQRVEQAQNE